MDYDYMLNRLKESLEVEAQRIKNRLTEIVRDRFFVYNCADFAYQEQCDEFNKGKYGFSHEDISHTTDVNVEFDIKVGSWKTLVDFKLHTNDGRSFYMRAVFDDIDVPNYWGHNTLAISAPLSKLKGAYTLCLFSKEEFDALEVNEFEMRPYDAEKHAHINVPKDKIALFIHCKAVFNSLSNVNYKPFKVTLFKNSSKFFFSEDGTCYESPEY